MKRQFSKLKVELRERRGSFRNLKLLQERRGSFETYSVSEVKTAKKVEIKVKNVKNADTKEVFPGGSGTKEFSILLAYKLRISWFPNLSIFPIYRIIDIPRPGGSRRLCPNFHLSRIFGDLSI